MYVHPRSPFFYICLFSFGLAVSCSSGAASDTSSPQLPSRAALFPPNVPPLTVEAIAAGESLAKVHCARCHTYIAPDAFPQAYWSGKLLPGMAKYLGIRTSDLAFEDDVNPAAKARLEAAGVFPPTPIIDYASWKQIWDFYVHTAPAQAQPGERPAIDPTLAQFNVTKIPWKTGPHGVSYVKILPNRQLLVGNNSISDEYFVHILTLQGEVLHTLPAPSPLVNLSSTPQPNEYLLSFIGNFQGSDAPSGSIGKLIYPFPTNLNDTLPFLFEERERPVNVDHLDFNKDNRPDWLLCEFGKELGGLHLYLNQEAGPEKVTIYGGPGAIHTAIRDVNNDGLPDIYALIAQGNEQLILFTNQGGNRFESKILFTFPPQYGSTYFELVDVDKDGDEDILYASGDSGDFGTPPKSFHGIRLLTNGGDFTFSETWFLPQQGTYKFVAEDFDQDGDIDIAAVGFFAFITGYPQEGFIYFENQGTSFQALSFPDAAKSSWITLDADDVDGDGDIDIILGANTTMMAERDMFQQLISWQNEGGTLTLLRNKLY